MLPRTQYKLNSIIFRERIWLATWVSFLFVFLIGILTTVIVIQFFLSIPRGNEVPTVLLIGFDVFFILLYLNFNRLIVEIGPVKIEVKYGLIKRAIPIKDVLSCEPIRASFGMYGGPGIRYGGDGSLAFITSFGDAVKIRMVSGRTFAFSTNRQDEVLKLVDSLLRS